MASASPPAASPQPITASRSRSQSLSTAIPSHPLSLPPAYTRAFGATGQGNSAAPPALSTSPTASTVSEGPKTPPSTSPTSQFSPTLKALAGANQKSSSAISDEDLLFANGARWGWPSSNTVSSGHGRRPSLTTSISGVNSVAGLGIGSPPGSSSMGMMAPLSRVQSAGASYGSQADANSKWGIFRRFSTGGGQRPKPPSPPPTSMSIPELSVPAYPPPPPLPSAMNVAPAPAPVETVDRGRKLGTSPPVKKRTISPMGERMLRGGLDH